MKMVNNTASSYSSNENAILSSNKHNSHQHMVNAISMESIDSVISNSNGPIYRNGNSDAQSQVRTLFVSGLPPDVKSRELYLLFRAYAGYESSQLKMTMSNRNGNSKISTPVGFVTFASRQDADDVRQKLQGVKFDPDLPQTLRLELARSNTKVTKPIKQSPSTSHIPPATSTLAAILPPPPPPMLTQNLAAAHLAALHHQQQQLTAALINQHHENSVMNACGANGTLMSTPTQHQQICPELQQLAALAAGGSTLLGSSNVASLASSNPLSVALLNAAHQRSLVANHWASTLQQQQILVNGQNSPCSTLFIGNLGPAATSSPSSVEEELKEAFGSQPGFSRIRMHTKRGSPVAFVEFYEVSQAIIAMQQFQGYMLTANNGAGTGIRIEFAKTRMGETNGVNFQHKQEFRDGIGGRA